MFGVLDSPEYSGAGVYRPIINDGKDELAMLRPSDDSTVDQMAAVSMHGFNPATLSGAPSGPIQVTSPSYATGEIRDLRHLHVPPQTYAR